MRSRSRTKQTATPRTQSVLSSLLPCKSHRPRPQRLPAHVTIIKSIHLPHLLPTPQVPPNLNPLTSIKLAQRHRRPRPAQFCSCPGFDERNRTNAGRGYKQLFKTVMSSRKAQPPALSIRTSSTESSPRCSSAYEESEADDEGNMAMAEYIPTRPLTVAIPKGYVSGPYCPRRPNLSEILANTAPPPWTLPAFMAYLSQNHCLETLEFTMDASRYRKHYSKWANRSPGSPVSPLSDECTYVKMLWQRLLDAYIAPNGPREVNLPSDVRDTLLSLSNPYVPPHPSTLDPAVSKIYELMEESVLVPFLNSLCPQTAHPDSSCDNNDEGLIRSQTRSYDDRAMYGRFTTSPQNMSASVPGPYYRASAPSSLTSNFTQTRSFTHTRFASGSAAASSSPFARMTPGSYGSGSDVLTDDSGSASSPSAIDDPMTPDRKSVV